MAKTGIKVQVTNTVLGAPPQVNANSMLFVPVNSKEDAQKLQTPKMLRSVNDLETALTGVSEAAKTRITKYVQSFYNPTSNVNNDGTILWLVGWSTVDTNVGYLESNVIVNAVRATVDNGFEYRPRQIAIIDDFDAAKNVPGREGQCPTYFNEEGIRLVKTAVTTLQNEGFYSVYVIGTLINASNDEELSDPYVHTVIEFSEDLKTYDAPFVAQCVTEIDGVNQAAAIVGYMSALSVGTSIGDGSFQAFAPKADIVAYTEGAEDLNGVQRLNVSTLPPSLVDTLGEKQYVFLRTRPPRNGLWWNDGATCADAATALSTLEAARTICSMVDDLRTFFVPYINSKVPVTAEGDIQSTYKQVVLDAATSFIVQPYVSSGDISDARIQLAAKDNDMVGTRTWEVTLSILPAPTLRWINGYVFYVKNLS